MLHEQIFVRSAGVGPSTVHLSMESSAVVKSADRLVTDTGADVEERRLPKPIAMLRQGIGLATDLYDLGVVNAIRAEFEECYGKLSSWENGAITSASHLGAIVGQLCFGYLADRHGRRLTFVATATLMFISAAGAAASMPVGNLTAAQVMMFFRFMLGVGIGGEYPLSAAVTAENASSSASAVHMAVLSLCFLVGQILSPTVVLICLYSGASAQVTWRVGIAGGAVLALVGVVLRLGTLQESQRWLESHATTHQQGAFQSCLSLKAVARPLAGTVLAWFVYDIVSYGVGGYTTSLFPASSTGDVRADRIGTMWNLLFIVALSSPGYFFTLCVGRFGRRCFQMVGFLGMGIAFFIMSQTYGNGAILVGVFIFGVQKSFDAFGPGAMTFMIPAEIFPTTVRASCHGISAAGGKLGAFVGTFLLPLYQEVVGIPALLFSCSVISVVGIFLTGLLTPPYDAKTLQELQDATRTDLSRTTEILWARSHRNANAQA